jgi:threonine/homoserine/homoserine lactone efflux protein
MSLEHSIAFLIFSVVAAVTPGPSNVMLVAAGAVAGVLRGIPCLIGVSVGMGTLLFSVALGLGQIVLAEPLILQALKWIGAAFLLWLSWKIASSGTMAERAEQKPVGFASAAVFQWINPKAWLVVTSAAGTYLQAGASALLQAISLALLFVAAALPSGLIWLAFGASVHRLLRNPRAARIFNIAMGVSLAASVAFILR